MPVKPEERLAIPFHRASVGEDEVAAVAEVIRSGWLTMGPKTLEFEKLFACNVGSRHAIAVSSCTAALHLSLEAIGLQPGDEVLVPTLTFAATAEVVAYFGAKPVLVDSEPEHLNIDVDDAEKKISRRTRAVIPVHFAGHPCQMESLSRLADAYKLTIIEDAAHAFPARYKGRSVGSISGLTAFSFYATKTLTTGEGGMVTTGSDEFADRIRVMRLHGLSRDAWKRYAGGSWRYDILAPGFKYNLTDIQAALGLVQLAKADEMRERRMCIAERYTSALAPLSALTLPRVDGDIEHAWHLYVVLLNRGALTIGRDQFIQELRDAGVSTAVHFIPLHHHRYYRDRWDYRPGQFPVADDYFDRCLSLPLYPDMTTDETDYVIEQIATLVNRYAT